MTERVSEKRPSPLQKARTTMIRKFQLLAVFLLTLFVLTSGNTHQVLADDPWNTCQTITTDAPSNNIVAGLNSTATLTLTSTYQGDPSIFGNLVVHYTSNDLTDQGDIPASAKISGGKTLVTAQIPSYVFTKLGSYNLIVRQKDSQQAFTHSTSGFISAKQICIAPVNISAVPELIHPPVTDYISSCTGINVNPTTIIPDGTPVNVTMTSNTKTDLSSKGLFPNGFVIQYGTATTGAWEIGTVPASVTGSSGSWTITGTVPAADLPKTAVYVDQKFNIGVRENSNTFRQSFVHTPDGNVPGTDCLAIVTEKDSFNGKVAYGKKCTQPTDCQKGTCRTSDVNTTDKYCLFPEGSLSAHQICTIGEKECDNQTVCEYKSNVKINLCETPDQQCIQPEDTSSFTASTFPRTNPRSQCGQLTGNDWTYCNDKNLCVEYSPSTSGAGGGPPQPSSICDQISDQTEKSACLCCSGAGSCIGNNKTPTTPGLWTAVGCIPTDYQGITSSVIKIGLSIAGGVALLMILAASFMLTTSRGEPKQMGEAKELLTSAVVGLLFIIFSVTLLQFIGVTILQIPGFGGGN